MSRGHYFQLRHRHRLNQSRTVERTDRERMKREFWTGSALNCFKNFLCTLGVFDDEIGASPRLQKTKTFEWGKNKPKKNKTPN